MLVQILLFFILSIVILFLFRLFNYTDGCIKWIIMALVWIIISLYLIIFNDNTVLLWYLVVLILFIFKDTILLIFKGYLRFFLLYLEILLKILNGLISCINKYHRLCTWNILNLLLNFIFNFFFDNLTNFRRIILFI